MSSFEHSLQPGEEPEVTRCMIWGIRRVIKSWDLFFGQELPPTVCDVCGRVVMVEQPGLVAPQSPPFVSNPVMEATEDLLVELLVDGLTLRHKLMVDQSLGWLIGAICRHLTAK